MHRPIVAAAVVAAIVLCSPPARAADHNLHVVEVGLIKGGDDTAQFIEIGDPVGEPLPSVGYDLAILDAAGTLIGGPTLLDRDLLRKNQAAFLVSTATADTAFGVAAHVRLHTPLPQDGQACIRRIVTGGATEEIHCLAWGTVTNPHAGASKGPAPGNGKSLQLLAGSYLIAPASPKVLNFAVPSDAGPLGGDDAGIGLDGGVGAPDDGGGSHDAGKSGNGSSDQESSGTNDGCTVSAGANAEGGPGGFAFAAVAAAALSLRSRRARGRSRARSSAL